MVKNFTTTQNETYDSDVKQVNIQTNEEFETNIKRRIQNLAKNPRQCIVENILDYSKSLAKK